MCAIGWLTNPLVFRGGGERVANYLPSRDVRFFEAWEKGGGKDSFLAGSRKEGEGGGKVE